MKEICMIFLMQVGLNWFWRMMKRRPKTYQTFYKGRHINFVLPKKL